MGFERGSDRELMGRMLCLYLLEVFMTARKKKGLGFVVTGVVTAAVGGILMATTATPEWVSVGLSLITAVCGVIGIVFVAPDPTV